MSQFPAARHPPQRGFALAVSLIFLVALTLIAIVAIRTTGLGARMAANNAVSNEALESSESTRSLTENLVEDATQNYYGPLAAAWSCAAIGGCAGPPPSDVAPDNLWEAVLPLPAGMTILQTGRSQCPPGATDPARSFKNWAAGNDETGAFNPAALNADACYTRDVAAISGTAAYSVSGSIAVYNLLPLRDCPGSASGDAMIGGYEGVGTGHAGAGKCIYYFVQAEGRDPSGLAQSQTGAIYRSVTR